MYTGWNQNPFDKVEIFANQSQNMWPIYILSIHTESLLGVFREPAPYLDAASCFGHLIPPNNIEAWVEALCPDNQRLESPLGGQSGK